MNIYVNITHSMIGTAVYMPCTNGIYPNIWTAVYFTCFHVLHIAIYLMYVEMFPLRLCDLFFHIESS